MPELNFNAASIAPASNFEALPAGNYQAVISNSAIKATRSGMGSYLELAFDIIEGEYKGRKLWARLNLENPSAKAVEVAKSELSAICHAVGVLELRASEELHNLPLTVSVRCIGNLETGTLYNEIKGYAKARSFPQKAQSMPSPGTPSSAAPWRR